MMNMQGGLDHGDYRPICQNCHSFDTRDVIELHSTSNEMNSRSFFHSRSHDKNGFDFRVSSE